ncbi:hypothetical protein [uncultured Parasphingopyxis sp.]|uniref:hypothetical protein n=1 Tax=uncultured Parasphingopyxis sp. TaxID=1547918 RepID=UPI0026104E5A|nr:hypothetical protein [uncultured Parasphingopyxis sp.]
MRIPLVHTEALGMKFHRQPISVVPEEGELAVLDAGDDYRADKYRPAKFTDGEWRTLGGNPLNFTPTHWTRMVG